MYYEKTLNPQNIKNEVNEGFVPLYAQVPVYNNPLLHSGTGACAYWDNLILLGFSLQKIYNPVYELQKLVKQHLLDYRSRVFINLSANYTY